MPLLLGKWIVGSHVGLQGRDAEEWLAMAPMEMGRYADLLLNVILGILIFYFPGGYTWMLFLGMAGSHCWIYLFDHCKVLRYVPTCDFAGYEIEWCCQAMFAPILGLVASCLVFKSNCEEGYLHCATGMSLILICTLGWFVHVVVLLMLLVYVVPMMGMKQPEEDPHEGETYQKLAERIPCAWFSSNPVHCLRSAHFYQHDPPCEFYVPGMEAHLKANVEIGCYYQEDDKHPGKAT